MNQESVGNLYFLKSSPPLTEHETFNASGETANLNSNINFRFWNFYLNTGSEASFTVCYQQGVDTRRDVIFYIIRGTSQLNRWTDQPGSTNAERSYPLTTDCDTITYQVVQDEMHYFVFYLSGGSSSTLDVNFTISRTLYSISPDNVINECSFALDGSSSCVLSAPINSGYTAALSLNASRPINYADDGAEILIFCQARAWIYALIVLAVVIIGVLICVCGIAIFVKVVLTIIKTPSSKNRSRVTTTPPSYSVPMGSYPHQL